MSTKNTTKAVMAEFLATALFVYVGCGSVLAGNEILGISLAFGLSITVLAFTIGHYSGGHINPIVTIAMVIWNEINLVEGLLYIVAQLVGAMTGAAILLATAVTVEESPIKRVVNQVNDDSNIGGAFLIEAVLSFLLVFVISETAMNKHSGAGNNAPIAIGFAVFMAHIVGIRYTGTSINPARSFGPAVVSGEFHDLWLFFVAPITGGIVAALVARFVFESVGKRKNILEQLQSPTETNEPSTSYVSDMSEPLTSTNNVPVLGKQPIVAV